MILILSILTVFSWAYYNDYQTHNPKHNKDTLQRAIYERCIEILRGGF